MTAATVVGAIVVGGLSFAFAFAFDLVGAFFLVADLSLDGGSASIMFVFSRVGISYVKIRK
mgnify:CR=1 FL=1